jgi:hypothetical protein
VGTFKYGRDSGFGERGKFSRITAQWNKTVCVDEVLKGHGFSRAATRAQNLGFSPWGTHHRNRPSWMQPMERAKLTISE